jgi:DNA-binding NtrC family response regulator
MAIILIVEDDALTRQIAEMIVGDLRHEALTAADVNEALTILRSAEPIDAVFTDIDLMGDRLGGCELASAAILLRPSVRILYTTGATHTAALAAAFVAGSAFLPKPYTFGQLETSITRLLAA